MEKVWTLIVYEDQTPIGWTSARTLAGVEGVLRGRGLDDVARTLAGVKVRDEIDRYGFLCGKWDCTLYRSELH